MSRSLPGRGSAVRLTAAVACVAVTLLAPAVGDDRGSPCVVVASCRLPPVVLAAAAGDRPAVMLGGISDLFVESEPHDGVTSRRAWAITDRGPNGMATVDGRAVRTLAVPEFAPRILELDVAWTGAEPGRVTAAVRRVARLEDGAGEPLTGRPNGAANDPVMVDPSGCEPIEPDPDGIDPEGLVRMRDGRFWVAEEYRPSLLEVAADGGVRRRFVPHGSPLPGAGVQVLESLPGRYSARRDNRGFESLAVAPDESRLYALLQSPLDAGDVEQARRLGRVRLAVLDPATGAMLAEHVYRLGDPDAAGHAAGRASPRDGKLCAMAAVGGDRLLVLEQAEGGVARLYLADPGQATDTLALSGDQQEPALETTRDLERAGVIPVAKTLVGDLGPLMGGMRSAAGGGDTLKIEGMAIADPRHVFLVNDDDFGVRGDARDQAGPSTCLWVVRLPASLPLTKR